MKRTFMITALAVALAFIALAQEKERPPEQAGTSLSANLTGAAEVPGPGDPDGSGTAKITLDPDKGQVCFELSVSNIQAATAAHIHEGAEGKAGGVKIPLKAPSGGTVKDCVSADVALIKEVINNPSNYYVNVHNAEFPKGAVRGQLSK